MFYPFFGLLLAGVIWLFYNFQLQFFEGHHLTGQGSQGAIWGILVANIVHFIGISHVGIAISAVVRILNLERYKQLARIAELVTLASLTTAVLNISMDVGRPDRFLFNVIKHGRFHAPFVWSMTVISAYYIGSTVYLYLAMRRDLYICSVVLPPHKRWLYKILALGYSDTPQSRQTHDRVVWWLAVIILPIMVSVHSVYGYIFGMQAGRPGWFNPFQAPYFVLGAIVTGFSFVIIVLAILRQTFRWQEIFYPRIFKGLGVFLGFVTLLYLYFLFSEWLTGIYAPPAAERIVFHDVLFGRFANITWPATILGMVIPFWIFFVQGTNSRICSVNLTLLGAIPVFISMWIWRYLIVVPSFYHPHLPYKVPAYVPTFFDWSLIAGSFIFCTFLYVVLVKVLPVLELPEELEVPAQEFITPPYYISPYEDLKNILSILKRITIPLTLMAGIGLIAIGIITRENPPAPAIWVLGICVLWTVPLQICVLPRREWVRGYR
jgi:molybdopterin-containing oxidoreductase family membrane subunit